jgi:hypothetical protein
MLEDHLKVVRFERRIRLWDRARHFLAERGMDVPTRRIPLNIALPLLENATLEEDDDLQDVWARLLVNGGDANSGIELRRAFVPVLAEMSTLDVRNLAAIESATTLAEGLAGILTDSLPKAATAIDLLDIDWGETSLPSPDVEVSLSNLDRLGCINSVDQEPLLHTYHVVSLTPFGRALIEACTR